MMMMMIIMRKVMTMTMTMEMILARMSEYFVSGYMNGTIGGRMMELKSMMTSRNAEENTSLCLVNA
jgi:hypothetical protein